MTSILLTLLLSSVTITPLELITYKDRVCSALHIKHRVSVVYKEDKYFVGEEANAYAYVRTKDHIVIRLSSLKGGKTFIKYLVTHEACHIYYRHYEVGRYHGDISEVQATDCVKRLVGPARWKEFDAAISRANRKRIVLLSR